MTIWAQTSKLPWLLLNTCCFKNRIFQKLIVIHPPTRRTSIKSCLLFAWKLRYIMVGEFRRGSLDAVTGLDAWQQQDQTSPPRFWWDQTAIVGDAIKQEALVLIPDGLLLDILIDHFTFPQYIPQPQIASEEKINADGRTTWWLWV